MTVMSIKCLKKTPDTASITCVTILATQLAMPSKIQSIMVGHLGIDGG